MILIDIVTFYVLSWVDLNKSVNFSCFCGLPLSIFSKRLPEKWRAEKASSGISIAVPLYAGALCPDNLRPQPQRQIIVASPIMLPLLLLPTNPSHSKPSPDPLPWSPQNLSIRRTVCCHNISINVHEFIIVNSMSCRKKRCW